MLSRLDVIALGLLEARPRTGYDVRKWLDTYGRAFGYTAQTSQIYRQLARLAEHGWAQVTPDPRTTGPDAKLYVLTEEGRARFAEWQLSPYTPSPRPMDPDFQVRMHFTAGLGPAAALALVRDELRFRRAQHELPLPFDAASFPADAGDEVRLWHTDLALMAEERGRALASTYIDWLEATERRLSFLVASGRYSAVGAGLTTEPRPSASAPARDEHGSRAER